jgi:hypothetical protein
LAPGSGVEGRRIPSTTSPANATSRSRERHVRRGDDFERIMASEFPARFNSDDTTQASPTGDGDRADSKGPEPEAIAEVEGRTQAIIGSERDSVQMIDDACPRFVRGQVTTRNGAPRGEVSDVRAKLASAAGGPESPRKP